MGRGTPAGPVPGLAGHRRRVRRRPVAPQITFIAGLVLLLGMFGVALLAPHIVAHDPYAQRITERLRPPLWQAGSGRPHLLGTDQLGRDVWSRLAYGGRVSLVVGFVAVGLSAVLGSALGLMAGYRGGRVGDFLMRLADAQNAFPFLVIALSAMAVLGPSFRNLVIVLAFWGWMPFGRLVRGEVLSIKTREFVLAAKQLGATEGRILARHVLPAVLPSLVVLATFMVAQTIVAESALSFLGFGVQPPTASWGAMLSGGRVYLTAAWWLSTFPGLAIMLTVLSVNLLGDTLRDRLDPRDRL